MIVNLLYYSGRAAVQGDNATDPYSHQRVRLLGRLHGQRQACELQPAPLILNHSKRYGL
jgi:hypothetical protein